jgi:ADP-ribose pyrophosphatase YjhB (NUDIX family)
MPTKFVLRTYGILIKDSQVLLADECLNGFRFSKFPGGGVELGEGIADALKREMMEEGQLLVKGMQHFYTTDFFQVSAFRPEDQIISVYYLIDADVPWSEYESDQSVPGSEHTVKLYFKSLHEVLDSDLTFPIDKVVLKLLKGFKQ